VTDWGDHWLIREACALFSAALAVFAVTVSYKAGTPAKEASYWLGMTSGAMWALSAGLPMYHKPAREWHQILYGFNLIAAIATAGAVITTTA
jgi:hypothetical protein